MPPRLGDKISNLEAMASELLAKPDMTQVTRNYRLHLPGIRVHFQSNDIIVDHDSKEESHQNTNVLVIHSGEAAQRQVSDRALFYCLYDTTVSELSGFQNVSPQNLSTTEESLILPDRERVAYLAMTALAYCVDSEMNYGRDMLSPESDLDQLAEAYKFSDIKPDTELGPYFLEAAHRLLFTGAHFKHQNIEREIQSSRGRTTGVYVESNVNSGERMHASESNLGEPALHIRVIKGGREYIYERTAEGQSETRSVSSDPVKRFGEFDSFEPFYHADGTLEAVTYDVAEERERDEQERRRGSFVPNGPKLDFITSQVQRLIA